MDIGSAESLRRRVSELQKTLGDVGVDSLPGLQEAETDDIYVVVTPVKTVRIPFQDFLNWEQTGETEIRNFPCYDKTLTKKFAYWITGHATVPLLF